MCWMCDDPTMTKADALDRMRELMDVYGWAVQFVEGDRVYAPWAYTVGLTRLGLPEIVVTGLRAGPVHELIDDLAHHYVEHDAPMPAAGEQLTLRGGPTLEVVELPHPDAHLLTTVALFPGRPFRALQFVWADDRGRWPWEVGFRSRRGGQPVLGPRAAPTGSAS